MRGRRRSAEVLPTLSISVQTEPRGLPCFSSRKTFRPSSLGVPSCFFRIKPCPHNSSSCSNEKPQPRCGGGVVPPKYCRLFQYQSKQSQEACPAFHLERPFVRPVSAFHLASLESNLAPTILQAVLMKSPNRDAGEASFRRSIADSFNISPNRAKRLALLFI